MPHSHPVTVVRRRALASLLLPAALLAAAAGAGPATQPAPRPTTRPPATRLTDARPAGPTSRPVFDLAQQRLRLLTSRGIRQLEAHDFKEARRTLTRALLIDPAEPTDLYNLACLDALTRHPDAAVAELKQAAENGFDDFAHIAVDPDLVALHDLPEYRSVLANKAKYMHVAAERAVAALRSKWGDGYLYEIDDADKFIFATNTDQTTLDSLKRMLVAQARSQWAQLFDHHPEGYTSIVVPSPADYNKVRPSPNVQGFYNPANHTLIASGLGFVTTHEFTHALYFGDLEQLDQNHPTWMVEGMAVLFEQTEYRDGVLTPLPNMRFYELRYYLQSGDMIPFPDLMKLDHGDFMDVAGPGYAESGGIMLYLYDHKLLRQFYDTMKDNYARDKTGKLALEKVTGKKLPALQKDWEAWMLKQAPPAQDTGPKGAFMGVAFETMRTQTTNDGVQIREVNAGGPADRAGLKAGDVVVGLNDAEVHDHEAIIPLLAAHKAGETVNVRVRRGKEYVVVPVKLGQRPAATQVTTRPFGRPTSRPATRPIRRRVAPTTRP